VRFCSTAPAEDVQFHLPFAAVWSVIVLPLAAYGELCGGEFDGLKVITKGGMAGDKYALKDCIAYLTTHI